MTLYLFTCSYAFAVRCSLSFSHNAQRHKHKATIPIVCYYCAKYDRLKATDR